MQIDQKYSIYVRGGTFKRGDTMRHVVISFKDEQGCWVTPNPDHTFVAKVANSSGYIGDYPVTVVDSDFIISTKVFAKLPDDQYELEIWEIWPSEGDEEPDKTIYPTPGTVVNFTIEANMTDKSGEVIKKIGFQDVVNAAVENAGLNLRIGNTGETEVGTQPTVTQEYKGGKNILSFTFPKPRAATVTIDKVNTVAPNQPASVTNTGDETDAKLVINLPQGIKGDMGQAPAMSVSSVTKLPAGSQPTVTYKKVEGGYTVAYALPQGADGATWQPYINKDDGHWHIKLTQGLPAVTEDDMKRLQDFITNQIENGKW